MKDFVFTVSESEANLIFACLAKQPYETVAGLVNKLTQQVQQQIVPPQLPENKAG
jgi:hypothetical protein